MIELRWITRMVKQQHGYPELPVNVLQYRVRRSFESITGEGQDCVVLECGNDWSVWLDVPQVSTDAASEPDAPHNFP